MKANWIRQLRIAFLLLASSLMLLLSVACGSASHNINPTPASGSKNPQKSPTTTKGENSKSPIQKSTSTSTDPRNSGGLFEPMLYDIPSVQYTSQEMRELPPEEVLREVAYSGGFGGGLSDCNEYGRMVGKVFDSPTILLYSGKIPLEWQEWANIWVCGFAPNEMVEYEVIAPDGNTIYEEQMQTGEDGGITWIDITADVGTPPGEYTYSFTGQEKSVKERIEIELIEQPRLFLSEGNLVLYNFHPNEKITLYIYSDNAKGADSSKQIAGLYDWEQFHVDNKGQLVIQIDNSANSLYSVLYAVIGEKTGEVHVFTIQAVALGQNIYSKLGFHISPENPSVGTKPKNVWDLVRYQDLYSPGTKTYTLPLQSSETLRWRFAWCAVNDAILEQNLSNIEVEFWADGEKLDWTQVAQQKMVSDNTWPCNRWNTHLSGWKSGAKHTLEIRYSIKDNISDGASNFYEGDYRQVINVEVK